MSPTKAGKINTRLWGARQHKNAVFLNTGACGRRRKNLDPLFESEKKLLNVLQSDEFKSDFIEQLEVAKYLLEFYIYGIYRNNRKIVSLVEDENNSAMVLYL